mgnify:CR=1 FL=1
MTNSEMESNINKVVSMVDMLHEQQLLHSKIITKLSEIIELHEQRASKISEILDLHTNKVNMLTEALNNG